MKIKIIACLITMTIVFSACDLIRSQIIDPPTNDTIVPTDTVIQQDSIISQDTITQPLDTIAITNDTVIIGTGNAPGEYLCSMGDNDQTALMPGPLASLTIVKFYNHRQENKVIVQHPFKRYDGIEGQYEYYDNMDLYLNVLPEKCAWNNGCGLSLDLVKWADEEMHIAGTSPYIPLTDGYYLIDWKWHQLYPISAIAESFPNAYHDHFAKHIHDHVFMTDTDWKDVKDLTAGYDVSHYAQQIKGVEVIRICAQELACYYNEVQGSDTYLCWNFSIYYNQGMCFDNAYMYYKYGDCSSKGRTHHSYIAYCDSLQSVYQQHLIELINNGQIKEFGY